MPVLYIVAVPSNNLEDISMRALRILNGVDFILCEDTRVTDKLLKHYNIKTPAVSYKEFSGLKKINYTLNLLKQGKKLALVSGTGMPAFSEMGGKLAQAVIDKFGTPSPYEGEGGGEVGIEFVLGHSAVTAALSMSGIPADKFIFMGFPPYKKEKQAFIKKILAGEFPVVVYESKYRIIKFLEELCNLAKSAEEKTEETKGVETLHCNVSTVVVCREFSKMHETVYRGNIKTIIEKIKNNKDDQKGEFVVIIGK